MNAPMQDMIREPWVWGAAALAAFLLCTFLPLRIKDERLRKMVNWFVLIPVSLGIILYIYPMGIELFRILAVNWR